MADAQVPADDYCVQVLIDDHCARHVGWREAMVGANKWLMRSCSELATMHLCYWMS